MQPQPQIYQTKLDGIKKNKGLYKYIEPDIEKTAHPMHYFERAYFPETR